MRLLLVEDSLKLASWLARALQQHGYAVDTTADGAQADALLRTERYDVVVLDLSLPSMDGFSVLRRMRERSSDPPVLVLTARGDLDDRVRGLNLGADDYLTKPFELAELEARLQAVLRRSAVRTNVAIALGPLVYDTATRRFSLHDRPLDLRPKEREVLEVLVRHAGRPRTKTEIFEHVFSLDSTTGRDVVEIYIHRLRKLLAGSGVSIVTLRGLGYVIETH